MYEQKCSLLVEEAKRWIGTSESGGDNRGKDVEMFQKAVDGKAQGEPWCLAFVQFVVAQVDESVGGDEKTILAKTEHVMTLWTKTPESARVREIPPHEGCLILWQHMKDGKPTGSGHVGIVTKVLDENTVQTVEGNTGPGSGVEREGDGVFEKTRSLAGSKSMKVKGFLRCWENT